MSRIINTILTQRGVDEPMRALQAMTFAPNKSGFAGELEQICLYEDLQFQVIEGFGAALTESSASMYHHLSEPERQRFLLACFDPVKGLGYNFCRIPINSCDFSLDFYTYDDDAEDYDLKRFTILRDRKLMLPFLRAALRHQPQMHLYASPWSPPAWMKDNNKMINGGALRPECYDVWARYIARFLRAYREEGIELWGVTAQNEPAAAQEWESCEYTAEQEAVFIAEHLGPTLEKEGFADCKIMFWDYNKHLALRRAQGVLAHEKAVQYIHGMAVHWYSGDHFEALDYITRLYPNIKLYNTEACAGKRESADAYAVAEAYAHDIIGDLNHGVSGWTDWNILLDEFGGPCHVPNHCHAPLFAVDGALFIEPTYYHIAHFSRYIPRGARRIGVSRYSDSVECAAFQCADDTYRVVLLNRDESEHRVSLNCQFGHHETTIPAHSIMTLIY